MNIKTIVFSIIIICLISCPPFSLAVISAHASDEGREFDVAKALRETDRANLKIVSEMEKLNICLNYLINGEIESKEYKNKIKDIKILIAAISPDLKFQNNKEIIAYNDAHFSAKYGITEMLDRQLLLLVENEEPCRETFKKLFLLQTEALYNFFEANARSEKLILAPFNCSEGSLLCDYLQWRADMLEYSSAQRRISLEIEKILFDNYFSESADKDEQIKKICKIEFMMNEIVEKLKKYESPPGAKGIHRLMLSLSEKNVDFLRALACYIKDENPDNMSALSAGLAAVRQIANKLQEETFGFIKNI